DDLVRRVPLINKKEIRAMSLAGALNFEKQVHRREALWHSELAIRPEVFNGQLTTDNGQLGKNGEVITDNGELEGNGQWTIDNGQLAEDPKSAEIPDASSFIKRMTEWEAMEADLRSMAITVGKHPMAFL